MSGSHPTSIKFSDGITGDRLLTGNKLPLALPADAAGNSGLQPVSRSRPGSKMPHATVVNDGRSRDEDTALSSSFGRKSVTKNVGVLAVRLRQDYDVCWISSEMVIEASFVSLES